MLLFVLRWRLTERKAYAVPVLLYYGGFSLIHVSLSSVLCTFKTHTHPPTQIFELQSCLLSEDAGIVDETLLRECATWFRPQHLQDIVIERSEAEGRCVTRCAEIDATTAVEL